MHDSKVRDQIIGIYKKNVHGRQPDTSKMTKTHDGKKGHWLEDVMGSKRDASNKPDLFGYEMKTGSSKTSFGDWGPDYFIFRDEKKFPNLIGKEGRDLQKQASQNKDDVFLRAFGVWRNDDKENSYGKWDKGGYYSWSGKPSPTKATDGFNRYGQALVVNADHSISIKYSFSKDCRDDKSKIVPKRFQMEELVLFGWSANWIKNKVENKFSVLGWFKCNIKKKEYVEIMFGDPITATTFLEWIKCGNVIFDTRMKQRRPNGSDRMGMMFRANNAFWKSLAVYTYP